MTLSYIPDLVHIGTLDEMIEECKGTFESLNPGLLESESDYYMPVIEAQAEREFRLRAEINKNFKNQFWMVAEGEWLDFTAAEYGVTRLAGARPWARMRISLAEASSVDTTISSGLMFGGEEGIVAYTRDDVVIPAGSTETEVIAELDMHVFESDIKTEQILTPLPYLASVKQLEAYHDGADEESDEHMRQRVSLALEGMSAAGPTKAYIKHTMDADSRIYDVKVSAEAGNVNIVIDAETYDQILIDRVTAALNAEDVRPVSDTPIIIEAEQVTINVSAVIVVEDGYDANDTVRRANNAIFGMPRYKIGEDVSMARLIDAVFVEGVKDVNIQSPTENVPINDTQVARLGNVAVSYA